MGLDVCSILYFLGIWGIEMKYKVCGKGIYQFSLLPKWAQITHESLANAEKFRDHLAKVLDQSILYFKIIKVDD